MEIARIRRTFLDFFSERDHKLVPASSLVPDDPTLLFTSAGMVQFKPYFLGEKEPAHPRVASCQKCLRAVDLEEVGKDARHLSFFEMLGNFAFGDYFKLEAIVWAYELVTDRFGLDPNRIWASVHTTDDEAARVWDKEVGIPPDRLVRLDSDFWDMGVAGPCGPCSHLYYDRGDKYGEIYSGEGEPDANERYFEIWNLVFMQNIRDEAGKVIGDLPKRNVDTGMGVERMAVVLQEVPTVFDNDVTARILSSAEQVLGKRYGADAAVDVSLRVLTEHSRGLTFAIADGVIPANEGRGYVLRRLIRRAVRFARRAGTEGPVLLPVVDTAIEAYRDFYPEVAAKKDLIVHLIEREEEGFDRTLRQGLGILDDEIQRTKAAATNELPGKVAFRLHDTYGFPLEETREIAGEEGLSVGLEEFDSLMGEQRDRARAARATSPGAAGAALSEILASSVATEFVGYQSISADGSIVGIVADGASVVSLQEGAAGELVLDRTPFYPEGGGQIGDKGLISTYGGTFEVEDTRWGVPGVIVHRGRVSSGEIKVRDEAAARVDASHREGIRRSHTATHMVHWALRSFLGDHARQQGSLVEVGRLRFDFSHFEQVDRERLMELEEEVNRRVLIDDSVRAFETTYDFAMSIGATALFGEKYGDFVRVVEVGDYSKELCGGTHVAHTGQVGVIKFSSESSVGAGLRRVEAYTGLEGLRYLNRQVERLRNIAGKLGVDPDRAEERVSKMIETAGALDAQLKSLRASEEHDEVNAILASGSVVDLGGSRLVVLRRDGRDVSDLRRLAQTIRDQMGSGVVVIATARDGSANLVAASTRDLVQRGVSARDLLQGGADVLGGRAGGKPDLATTGGANAAELDRAVAAVEAAAREAIKGG